MKNLYEDLGLDFSIGVKQKDDNLITLVNSKAMLMDSPFYALHVHITNLVATYGEQAVKDAMADYDRLKEYMP